MTAHLRTTALVGVALASFALACPVHATDVDLNPKSMGLAIDNTGMLWVSQWAGDCVIGLSASQLLEDQDVRIVPGCENPRYVTLGDLGTRGYAASWDNHHPGSVVVFDLATGDVLSALTGGPSDCHYNASVAPDESWLYFANYYGGSVTRMSLPDGTAAAPVSVGPWASRSELTPDGRYLYVIFNAAVGAGDGLRVVDTSTNSAVYGMTLPTGGSDLKFSRDGHRLYVAGSGRYPGHGGEASDLLVLDTSTPAMPSMLDVVELGGQPWTVAVSDTVVAVGMCDGRICFVNVVCDDNNIIGYDESAAGVAGNHPILYFGEIYEGKAYFANFKENGVHVADVPAHGITAPHVEQFDSDMEWLTNNPSRFYVEDGALVGIAVTDANEYCTTPVASHPAGMKLEWDSYLVSSDWSGGIGFGLYDCGRWCDPVESDQLLRIAYGHDDSGYMVLLTAEDAEGHVAEVEMGVDLRGKWVHNVLTYAAATDIVAYAVSEGGQTLATTQLNGISGFTDVLCQLGFSLVHDCAVGGQTTIAKVDNVTYGEWGSWESGVEDPVVASAGVGNFPNPFNPNTTIAFSTASEGRVDVSVYDTSGRLVRQLLASTIEAGGHAASWDGRDDDGREVASGVYLYRIQGPGVSEEGKMALLK